jgi:hypothetical protein
MDRKQNVAREAHLSAGEAVGAVFGVAAAWISRRLSIFWKNRERLTERRIIS